jgi:FSR family fosmidomycin resistance protein-like MFS transporter
MNVVKKSFLLLWLCHMFMDFFTGIWPIYKTIAGLDITKAGMIAGLSGFMGEILQLGFGYFSDNGHRKKILMLGVALSSSIIWITFTEGMFQSFWLLFLLMMGSAAFHPSAVGLTGILSKEHKGRGILFFSTGGAIGFAISQLAFTKLISVFDGHAIIVLIPLVLVLGLLAFHKFPLENASKPAASIKGFFQPIMHCKKQIILLYLSQVATQVVVTALLFMLPDMLHTKSCTSWFCLGGGHFCYVFGSALTMIPAGYLSDKYGQKTVLLLALAASAIVFYFMLSQPVLGFGSAIFSLALLGAFLGIINPVVVSWGHRLVPESPSTISPLLMGFARCIGNLGSLGAGILASIYREDPIVTPLSILCSFLILAFICVLLVPRPETAPALTTDE